MGLGLLTSYAIGYLPTEGVLSPACATVVPALFLFAVIVAMPQAQLRIGQVKGIVSAPLPSLRRALGWGGGAAAAASPCWRGRLSEARACCWSAPRRRTRW